MGQLKPAYAYLRVSSKQQAEEDKDGFPRQMRSIKQYAKKEGYEITGDPFEEEITGKEENRPELARLMDALEQNGVKAVIIEKLDRLARDIMVQEYFIKDFQRAGVSLISTHEGPDLCSNDPTRKLIRHMFGAIAEYEKAMLVLKLRAARERKKAKGERYAGRKPYGITPEEQHIIHRVRGMRQARKNGTPGMSLREIAERLNEEKIPSKTQGTLWTTSKVFNVLHPFSKRMAKKRKEAP